MHRWQRWATACILAAVGTAQAQAGELTVMSFNVRTIHGPDGPNRWEMRRELFADTIAQQAPDLIGTQELSRQQAEDTVARLPQYRWFGRDRRGGHDDEHMGIFYRADRLRLLRSGDFWLSDTPGQVASISWGNLYPRMVNWGLFERLSDHRQFYLLDTHLPYREQDERARTLSAGEINRWIARLPANAPVILTGDFNTAPDSQAHALLSHTLHDAWQDATRQEGPDKTFHNFSGQATARIDWILYRGAHATLVRTVTTSRDGRYPSDHFPVLATLQL